MKNKNMLWVRDAMPGPKLHLMFGFSFLGTLTDRPILGRVGVAPVVGGHQLHISHRLRYLNGIIYCNTCGCFTDGSRVQKLAKPCLVDGVVQHAPLKRLRRGVHPKGPRATWPVHRIERYEIENYLDITEDA